MNTLPWLAHPALEQDPAILVTVASVEGSAPRETGAAMLVSATHVAGTIGGGHLEFCAFAVAREMLRSSTSLARMPGALADQRRLERLPLGPTLGQCCGGIVHLAFERIDAAGFAELTLLAQRWHQGRDTWRLVSLDSDTPPLLVDGEGACLDAVAAGHALLPAFERSLPCRLLRDADGKRWLIAPCLPYRARLFLFGAGHVGAALVRSLADLPCHVTWIDERAELFSASLPAALPSSLPSSFPSALPTNVTIEVSDTPEALVDAAPAGTDFLVMTHSHALDMRLAERILARDDSGWFGLIGSRTKRLQFERRLRARGIAEPRIAAMTCPIGIDGIDGKAPAVIAVAVAAQLLRVWEQQAAARAVADQQRRAVTR